MHAYVMLQVQVAQLDPDFLILENAMTSTARRKSFSAWNGVTHSRHVQLQCVANARPKDNPFPRKIGLYR